ncbi:MAG TPA: MBL fold metallo-hydrolase [Dehalococcoidales bacterium]|nr:MBL fold metallo-hydrolase [Dehalococcoidales bacterium]
MKVKWLGHSAFLLTSEKGVRIITDPYKSVGEIKYGAIKEPADVVTVSHEHFDHNNAAAVPGNPEVFRGPASREIKGIKFTVIAAFHDNEHGKLRSTNMIVCMDLDGMRLCHLGDLGHLLTEAQIAQAGKIDILFIPVGGFYTIDATVATKVIESLRPKVAIPMHFKNERHSFPLAPVSEFLKEKNNVTLLKGSEMEFTTATLPEKTQIVVFKPAL